MPPQLLLAFTPTLINTPTNSFFLTFTPTNLYTTPTLSLSLNPTSFSLSIQLLSLLSMVWAQAHGYGFQTNMFAEMKALMQGLQRFYCRFCRKRFMFHGVLFCLRNSGNVEMDGSIGLLFVAYILRENQAYLCCIHQCGDLCSMVYYLFLLVWDQFEMEGVTFGTNVSSQDPHSAPQNRRFGL